MPAEVGGAVWSARLQRKAALREPPRPGSRSVRGMPMMQKVYLAAGMPAAASRSIRAQMLSISRCRSGSLPSRDMGALRLLDRPRRQRQLHHVEREAERLDVPLVAAQIVEAPTMRVARRID